MTEQENIPYTVHVHFHGTPTPEFLEVFKRMLDIAAKAADNLGVHDVDEFYKEEEL